MFHHGLFVALMVLCCQATESVYRMTFRCNQSQRCSGSLISQTPQEFLMTYLPGFSDTQSKKRTEFVKLAKTCQKELYHCWEDGLHVKYNTLLKLVPSDQRTGRKKSGCCIPFGSTGRKVYMASRSMLRWVGDALGVSGACFFVFLF